MSNHHLHHRLLLLWTLGLLALQPLFCHASSVIMNVNPSPGKITVGSQGSVECRLQNPYSNTAILWYRRQGNIWYKVGSDSILTLGDGTVQNNRYQLQQQKNSDNSTSYILTISDARLEDSSTIECRLSTDLKVDADASGSFVICTDIRSSFCDCMYTRGWASPDCFSSVLDGPSVASTEDLRRSVVALIVTFVVVVAYAIIMVLVWKREALKECCQEEVTEDMKSLNGPAKSESDDSDRGQVDPSDSMSDSATCSTSDPSSSGGSDGPGSNRSAAGSHSSGQKSQFNGSPDEPTGRKMESSFTVRPEIHYNQGFSDDVPRSSVSQRRKKSRSRAPNSPVDGGNFELKGPSLAGQGAFGEMPYANYNTQSNYTNPTMISTVSGSVAGSMANLGGAQAQKSLGIYYAPSMLSLRGSQSHFDGEATEI